jgi:hypothetical protein
VLVCAGLAGVVLYWRRFDDVRRLAWLAFAPLLFFNYRSLANYVIAAAPVAAMVLVARHGRGGAVPLQEVTTSADRRSRLTAPLGRRDDRAGRDGRPRSAARALPRQYRRGGRQL